MNLLENISDAIATIVSNKLRSGLTMLGIIIGVASVVVMIAIGQGAQASVTSRIEQLGSNLLIVVPGGANQTNVRSSGGSTAFTDEDTQVIQSETQHITAVSPEYSGRKQIIFGNQNVNATVTGVVPVYEDVRNFHAAVGQFISDQNNAEFDRVVVLGSGTVDSLFPGGGNLIGADIKIENTIFTIIGVMESKGSNLDNGVFVPLTTAQKRIFGVHDKISQIYVSVDNAANMETAKETLTAALLKAHNIPDPENADFTVLNQADAISTLNDVTQIFTLLLGGIAGISLLVGGIGVMNIMLVSVTERTREIGIRKAIGARRFDILVQFLIEAVLISVLGGMIGIVLSSGTIAFVRSHFDFQAVMSFSSLVLATSFSIVIGIFFGIFPAYKASKLKPIEALRFE